MAEITLYSKELATHAGQDWQRSSHRLGFRYDKIHEGNHEGRQEVLISQQLAAGKQETCRPRRDVDWQYRVHRAWLRVAGSGADRLDERSLLCVSALFCCLFFCVFIGFAPCFSCFFLLPSVNLLPHSQELALAQLACLLSGIYLWVCK